MNNIENWISKPRFDKYLLAANRDFGSAKKLYEWNSAVSSAFFELISYVEVSLRNAVDNVMRKLEVPQTARAEGRVSQGWWFADSAFLTDRDLEFYNTAKKHLGNDPERESRNKVFASMTFGMWEVIFGKDHEQLFRKHLIEAFPSRCNDFTRKLVQGHIIDLKNLRNRIAHHQPIFDIPLEERFEEAMDILYWIDPDLNSWVADLCRVQHLLDTKPQAADPIAVIVPVHHGTYSFYEQTGTYISAFRCLVWVGLVIW